LTIKIKVEHLTKIFGRHPHSVIKKLERGMTKDEILEETGHTVGIHDVSFEVNEGETFVIMGLSGSGKSTLIRCLNLLNKPTMGKIFVDGENIVKYKKEQLSRFRKNKVAMVFQHFGLFTHRSVVANVEYGLEVKGIPKKNRREIAAQTLATVGLNGWEDKYPSELSGGMQQRVGLARALCTDPDILLMDEPFSALDPLIRRDMQLELLELQSKLKKTIIFITHDVNEAFKLGDRVAVMKEGKIEQVATPEQILANPANDYICDFVRDIDRTKVLQAKNIMYMPSALISLKDGPQVAVSEMKKYGISSVFVVDSRRILQGLVTIDDTVRAVKENKGLGEILMSNYYTTDPDAFILDLIPKATDSKYPIAVVDENNKILGIIMRVTVLASLI
jgi:glycine betaine/proline transport system ATP-binding protein